MSVQPASSGQDTEKEVRAPWRDPIAGEPHLFLVLAGAQPRVGGLRCCLRGVDEMSLGRGERWGIVPGDPQGTVLLLADTKVSSRHARIVRRGPVWRLTDLGSTNGTTVNGRRIEDEELTDGDVIGVGQTIMRFRSAIPTPLETPDLASDQPFECGALGLRTMLPALATQLRLLERVVGTKAPVLLLGETGTGKEVVAKAIHAASRRPGRFVAINCAALPSSLLEAQLFGHVRGSFSGATRDEGGLVRAAHEGTLFLDEIGDLPLMAQGSLLRVLQEGEVVPVGATRPVPVDVRFIAATHRPIEQMAETGEFRADLFARLCGFTHRLWPLRERREDVGLLVADLLSAASSGGEREVKLTADAARALVLHRWPRNVRELAHTLSRALALAGGAIDAVHLPDDLRGAPADNVAPPLRPLPLSPADAALRDELFQRLGRTRGNVAAVAREMGKAPMQVYRWMQRFGLDPKTHR